MVHRSGKRGSRAAAGEQSEAPPRLAAWWERRPRAAKGIACAVLVLATILAYSSSLNHPFIFDDRTDIVENPSVHSLWPVWRVFLSEKAGKTALLGRPVVNLSLAVNYAIGGLDTRHYHATNLAVHLLAGLTLFGIVRRTLCLPRLHGRYAAAATPLAFVAAAIWMLHPLQTQAVAFIIQRYESMMGMFYLVSLYCAIRSDSSPHSRWWAAGSVAACLLAMGCKEVAVSAPLVILLYDRAFLAGTFREAWRRRGAMYVGLAATWAVFAAVLTSSYAARRSWAGFALPTSSIDYAKTQFGVILHYLRLSFWPDPLIFDYGWPIARTAAEILPGLVVVGGLAAATAYALVRWPMWGTVGAWFFLILAPTSSIMPIADLAFEHRMYLSLAAVVAATVIVAYELLERLFARLAIPPQKRPWFELLPALAVLVAWGTITHLRNEVYESELSVWYDVLNKTTSNARANYNLGFLLDKQGRAQEAAAYCRKALEIDPQCALAHNGLAVILCRQGKIDEGIAHLEEALKTDPRFAEAHYNLAQALFHRGKIDEGIAHYEKALAGDTSNPAAHDDLGQILYFQGRIDEAIARYQKALQIDPSLAPARWHLGNALYLQGKRQEAVSAWREVVRRQPEDVSALRLLAWALATCPDDTVRNGAEAVQLARRAVQLSARPSPALLDTLAAACAEAGQFSEAAEVAQRALELASGQGDRPLVEALRARIKLYQARTAFRETGSASAGPKEKHSCVDRTRR